MRQALLPVTMLASLLTAPALAQQREVPVCSSRDAAQLLLQAGAAATLPQGCRVATVRRLDTPGGALCAIEIGQQEGVVGALRDAVATTEWWIACADLRAP